MARSCIGQACTLPISQQHLHSTKNSFVFASKSSKHPPASNSISSLLISQKKWTLRAASGVQSTTTTEEEEEPVLLGQAKLPADIDLNLMETLLNQWANSLTQNSNFILDYPLKVDKIQGGVRLAYVQVIEGVVEELVHIRAVVMPATEKSQPLFQAHRCGKLRKSVPPGEPAIMRNLLAALKKSVSIATQRPYG